MLQTSQVNYSVINHNSSGAIHWIHCKDEAAQKVRDIFEKFEPGLSQPDVLQPIYSNLKNDLSLVAVASSENALHALETQWIAQCARFRISRAKCLRMRERPWTRLWPRASNPLSSICWRDRKSTRL